MFSAISVSKNMNHHLIGHLRWFLDIFLEAHLDEKIKRKKLIDFEDLKILFACWNNWV